MTKLEAVLLIVGMVVAVTALIPRNPRTMQILVVVSVIAGGLACFSCAVRSLT